MSRIKVILGLSLGLAGVACAVDRLPTQPPDYQAIHMQETKSHMALIAVEASKINKLLRGTEPVGSAEEVDGHLARIELLATKLQGTHHPMIGRNLPRFQGDVRAARMGLKEEPPNFFLAGTISGACQYCHKP